MTDNQIKTDAINDFVCMMISSLDAGFLDKNNLTLAEIHRVAQNYCKDKYSIELPGLVEQWGEDTAKMCGLTQTK